MDELRTERLLLRRARMDDAAAVHRLMSDRRAMRYWSTPPHGGLEQTLGWLRSMIGAPADESDDFLITLNGKVIGKLGCWQLPEVGYLLDPEVWGRGFATEAMQAFAARRRALGSPELTADVDPRNIASRQLLERCGFSETGSAARTWCVGGEWCDSIYYRLAL
ncbi:GNAT family N-acetyltransferase [Sphingomonas sp. GCM10030256]|uniref:GNAT family N-acetyltransferase n=1 Tax=Sphingomonas sp. GCM10030256 TaxID=3273427 RepID=UPI0036167ABC